MALTEVDRATVVHGPIKQEFVIIDSDGTNDDPVETRMFNPTSVTINLANTDAANTADPVSVSISGKTATVRDATDGRRYVLSFLGF